MLLFRSEEAIDGWSATTGQPRGESVPLRTVWELSQIWYGNRMAPDFHGRTIEQVVEVFNQVGLSTAFWRA